MLDNVKQMLYTINVRQGRESLRKGSEGLDEMANVSEYLLRAILELIAKCKTIEELRESVERILKDSE